MPWVPVFLLTRTTFIIDKEALREDVKRWRMADLMELISESKNVLEILHDFLKDEPLVRKNTLYLLKELVEKGIIGKGEIEEFLDEIIKASKDRDERVALQAVELLNVILENVDLDENDYDRVSHALMDVLSSGRAIISEYAAEGLGVLGSKVLAIARKVVGWLFSLIAGSDKHEVQGAAITALTEMASKSSHGSIVSEIFAGMADLLESDDSYVRERAMLSLNRIATRRDALSERVIKRVLPKVKAVLNDDRLSQKASLLLARLEASDETVPVEESVRKALVGAEKYSVEDIEKLFEQEKHEIVAEMARTNPEALARVMELLRSEEKSLKLDALWVLSRVVDHLTPDKAYSVLPTLGELLRSRNAWTRTTVAKTLAEMFVLYPGTSKFILSLIDTLLNSNDPNDLRAGLEVLAEINKRLPDNSLFRAGIILLAPRLLEPAIRKVILSFLAEQAEHIPMLDAETLEYLGAYASKAYSMASPDEREVLLILLDLLHTLKSGGEMHEP